MSEPLHIGLVVNPLAGLGGSLALKGSDGIAVRELAAESGHGQNLRSIVRAERALAPLQAFAKLLRFSTWAGDMGASALAAANMSGEVLGAGRGLTAAADTRAAAVAMLDAGVDLILFAGGDGTARDIFDSVGQSCPVLGIPTGVKMHSGVFAVSPEAAGELLLRLAQGGLVGVKAQEVRDIDEEAFRRDIVRSRFYGELMVPGEGEFLQHTKVGGREDPGLAAADIAAWQAQSMEPGRTYLIGPGSTTAAVMEQLGLPNTLLGVDVVRDGNLLARDVNEERILALLADGGMPASIVATVIGGQGYLFGRGNQQFSPAVINAVGVDNVIIVAAKSKIAGLDGRPLLVDTNDPQLDLKFCGLRPVNTGYDDHILCRVSNGG